MPGHQGLDRARPEVLCSQRDAGAGSRAEVPELLLAGPEAHRTQSWAGGIPWAAAFHRQRKALYQREGSRPLTLLWESFLGSKSIVEEFTDSEESVNVTGNRGGSLGSEPPEVQCLGNRKALWGGGSVWGCGDQLCPLTLPTTPPSCRKRPVGGQWCVERALAGRPGLTPPRLQWLGHTWRVLGGSWSRAGAAELQGPWQVGDSLQVLLEAPLGPQGSLQGHKELFPTSHL